MNQGLLPFLSLTVVSVEFRVWNEVTVKIWIEGESGIIKAITGFCGSSDVYYTCRTVPISSKFHVGQTEPLPFEIYSVYYSMKYWTYSQDICWKEREKETRAPETETERRWRKQAALGPQLCLSAGCDHCRTKSGSRTALLYIRILTPISRVSTGHELEPDSLSRGLCPALAHQLEFLLQGHTVKISQERQQLCIFKEMGSFFFP